MNAVTTDPRWLAIVQQCEAQGGGTQGLPSLAPELGQGCWVVRSNPETAKGLQKHLLYWYAGTSSNPSARKYHRIGSFQLAITDAQKPKPRVTPSGGELTKSFDDQGRRLILVAAGPHCKEHIVMAVQIEQYRGEWLPRPVPVKESYDCQSSRQKIPVFGS